MTGAPLGSADQSVASAINRAAGGRPIPGNRVDLLIDGPFVAPLAQGAGEWRGSRNQRLIAHPSTVLSSMPNAVATP